MSDSPKGADQEWLERGLVTRDHDRRGHGGRVIFVPSSRGYKKG